MWSDFQLHLGAGSGEQSPERARQWVAGLMNEAQAEERPSMRLFHADEMGHPMDGVSPVRFGAGRDMIRLYAVGASACDLLAQDGHKITRLISRNLARPIKEIRQSGQCNIEQIPYLYPHHIRGLVLKHYSWDELKPLDICKPGGWDQPKVREAIVRSIETGIRDQAKLLSLDGMGLNFEAPDDVLVDLISVDKIVPFEVKPGSRRFRLSAQKIQFRLNLKLGGPWHVGRLTSRGFGLIRACGGY